jgi:hypothetical protein
MKEVGKFGRGEGSLFCHCEEAPKEPTKQSLED